MIPSRPYVVGITGGSASGKTLFINKLLEAFRKDEICLLSQDHYYLDRQRQPRDANGIENFDQPESIDHEAFKNDIITLIAGKEIHRKEYTFNNKNREAKDLVFQPAPIIVVEGLFSFYKTEYLELYNLKLFIEANEPIKIVRRISRDKDERGYDLDDVLYRYEKHVYPTYVRYIEPFKNEADIIIPNHTSFEKALEVVISHLKHLD